MLSERNWRIEGVGRMFIGLIVTTFCLMLLVSSVRQLTGDLSNDNKSLLDIILNALVFQGIGLLWVAIFLREEKLSLSSAFGLKSITLPRALIFGLVTGICVVPIAWTLQIVSVQVLEWWNWNPQSQELVQSFQQSAKSTVSKEGLLYQRIAFGVSVIVLAPISEEIVFRGILYPTIKKIGFPRIGMWVSALIFASMHQNLAGMLPFLFLGIVLVMVYEETDNLVAPILTHSLFNTANFVYMLFEAPINKFLFRT